jgi:flagellar biogenesis protein FliO
MLQFPASTRSAAPGGTARCRWACIAVAASLIATSIATANEPGRARPQISAGPKTTAQDSPGVRLQNGPALRPLPETTPARPVRSADWSETTDGSADRRLRRVVPVTGDGVAEAGHVPTHNKPRSVTAVNGTAPAKINVPAAEPLSRLTFTESSGEFDPGQTLRDWAEGAGLMLAFGVVALWLLRQWITRRDLPGGAMSHLRTIESLSLPQRCRIHLVDVDGRQVLVAADAAGIKSVTVLPDRFAHLLDVTDEHPGPGLAPPAEQPEMRGSAWHGLQESRPA